MSWLVLVLSGVLEAVWATALGCSSAVTRSVESGPTQPSASTTTTPTSPCSRRQTATVASSSSSTPTPTRSRRSAPAPNEIGMHRVAFSVDDIDQALQIAARHDGHPLRGVATYEDIYKLTSVRGPGSSIIAIPAEELKKS